MGIAMRLGQEGARIVLVEGDRDIGEHVADQLDAKGIEGRLLIGDLADPSAAKWAVTTATLVWGRLDILVHTPSRLRVREKISEVGLDALDAAYRADVRVPLLFCREVIPQMVERGYGRIVTLASIAGKDGHPLQRARSSAQASLIGLTKAVAMSVGDAGIRVNTVCPGSIMFNMGGWDMYKQNNPDSFAAFLERELPEGRLGTDQEVADVIAFVVSERARWVNGAMIPVDGAQGRPTAQWFGDS